MVSSTELGTRPVGAQDLPALATLFGDSRNTRHCWCTAFCTTRTQLASGWLAGRNRRRFETIAGHGVADQSDAFVGREKVFEDLGFHRVARPSEQRSIMRLQLRTVS